MELKLDSMAGTKIFCEGVTDQVFIADCIESLYDLKFERTVTTTSGVKRIEIKHKEIFEIIEIGGCSNLSNPLYLSQLEDNTDLGGRNVVIFDADYTGKRNGNKGFSSCNSMLQQLKKRKVVSFDHYIWPDNGGDGIIEDLLRKLIPSKREPVFACIESHQECLKKLSFDDIKLSELKDKIGHYLYTCSLSSNGRERDYKNEDVWDIRNASCPEFVKFKSFLDKILSSIPKRN